MADQVAALQAQMEANKAEQSKIVAGMTQEKDVRAIIVFCPGCPEHFARLATRGGNIVPRRAYRGRPAARSNAAPLARSCLTAAHRLKSRLSTKPRIKSTPT